MISCQAKAAAKAKESSSESSDSDSDSDTPATNGKVGVLCNALHIGISDMIY